MDICGVNPLARDEGFDVLGTLDVRLPPLRIERADDRPRLAEFVSSGADGEHKSVLVGRSASGGVQKHENGREVRIACSGPLMQGGVGSTALGQQCVDTGNITVQLVDVAMSDRDLKHGVNFLQLEFVPLQAESLIGLPSICRFATFDGEADAGLVWQSKLPGPLK